MRSYFGLSALVAIGLAGILSRSGGAGTASAALIERRIVSQDEMDRWPVDRARSGTKCWAETTWGTGPLTGPHRNLFNWNAWPDRVVFEVDAAAATKLVVQGEAEWRRSSLSIRMKGLKLVAAATGEEVADARVVEYGPYKVAIDFRPVAGPGLYFLYYGAAEEACFKPSETWLKESQVPAAPAKAEALRIEARCKVDAFDDMEIVAKPDEVNALLAKHAEAPYLVFPEDRDRPIKLQFELPVSWAADGPRAELTLAADRNEYRVFQLGLWAGRRSLADVALAFGDLRTEGGDTTIPAVRLRCLTLESRIKSRYIEKPAGPFPVPVGEVRALWCGIDVPADVPPGVYTGNVTVKPKGTPLCRKCLFHCGSSSRTHWLPSTAIMTSTV